MLSVFVGAIPENWASKAIAKIAVASEKAY